MDKFKRKHPGFRVYEKSVSRTADGGTVLLAEKDFPLFTEILECGIRNFEKHAASYEISAKPELTAPLKLRH